MFKLLSATQKSDAGHQLILERLIRGVVKEIVKRRLRFDCQRIRLCRVAVKAGIFFLTQDITLASTYQLFSCSCFILGLTLGKH